MDEVLLARIFAHQGTIIKCQIEAEGMKAANTERENRNDSVAYNQEDFSHVAIEVENAVSELKSIGEIV